jgi:predicted nucleic acid-binding protein
VVLVDTNVVVALLVENTPWFAQARALHQRDPDWRTESHALVELTNVLTRYVRVGEFDLDAASAMCVFAEQKFSKGLVVIPHAEALQTALRRKVSAYDARFLLAAQYFGTRLVTEDAKLRRAAPELTQSLEHALTVT